MKRKPVSIRPKGADYEFRIVGDHSRSIRDFYHRLLGLSWSRTFLVIAGGFLAVNAVFACAFLATGGIANARPGSFADAFYFSVQTTGTIGYGAMYPESTAANLLVVLLSIVGLMATALATGLVFSKFSRPTARVEFTREAVITLQNGQPTLMFRLGNERGNQIVDVQFRVVLSRTEHTAEGTMFYRSYDLHLVRGRALSLQRSWTVMHVIDAASPLYGMTPERMAEEEAELQTMVVGLDDTWMQTVHASHRYYDRQILWGMRHADVLSEESDGTVVLDLNKFHDLEPTAPSETFPYPK